MRSELKLHRLKHCGETNDHITAAKGALLPYRKHYAGKACQKLGKPFSILEVARAFLVQSAYLSVSPTMASKTV